MPSIAGHLSAVGTNVANTVEIQSGSIQLVCMNNELVLVMIETNYCYSIELGLLLSKQ